jgi:hypothetical protein
MMHKTELVWNDHISQVHIVESTSKLKRQVSLSVMETMFC